MGFRRRAVIALAGCAALAAAPVRAQAFPPTEAGARALIAQFAPGSTVDVDAAMTRLRPTATDYRTVYGEPRASRLEAAHRQLWASGQVIAGKAGQTEILVVFASTDDLIAGKPVAGEFPGGYAKVAGDLRPGVPIVRFKFVEPGKTAGMAFDGLVHVNGRWVFIPGPWRVD
ncbi:MAG: hypothetical protein IPK81_08065 [Rhodospirillales bacterium]|nr:MAG: hypothetical protein IPK81_08065 [Rhodospirillales bacterium]